MTSSTVSSIESSHLEEPGRVSRPTFELRTKEVKKNHTLEAVYTWFEGMLPLHRSTTERWGSRRVDHYIVQREHEERLHTESMKSLSFDWASLFIIKRAVYTGKRARGLTRLQKNIKRSERKKKKKVEQ